MDGLIHAALEAESILNRAKHVNPLSPYDSCVQEHKMTWTHDKLHLTEPVDDSRMKHHRSSTGSTVSKSTEKFDLFNKLHELYNDLSRDESLQTKYKGLKTTSYLLEKLLASYNLNTLILNLYPGNKGYSLSLKINGNTQQLHPGDGNSSNSQEEALIETLRWPYEEEELLSYIDNEEIPVVLMDLLESEHSSLFYSGCVIAQIRDYRQAYPNFLCDTHHVLLRPTNQSIITDAMCIGTSDERAAVEAALVLATAPPLCLDPRPAVGLLAARLHSAPRLLNTPRIRRQARRFSQVAINRKRKLDQFTHYHGLELLELIHRQRAKNSRHSIPLTRLTSKFPKKPPEVFKPIEAPRVEPQQLAPPSEPAAPMRLARAYERPRPSSDCQPQLVEEYILETDKSPPHAGTGFFHIKLSILQRPSDQEFLGELYVDRDHVDGERNGSACRFTLGTRVQANKYIQQFTEIFTEEGRKSVRIKHVVPGQLPRVSFTGGMRELSGQQLILQQRTAPVASGSNVQAHPTVVPVVTAAIAAAPNSHTPARSLPILQAQLQCAVPGAPAAAPAAAAASSDVILKPPGEATPRLSPQVHDLHTSQASTNQLLAQQLTNPPQPLNPQKMQSAIIHIQHPLMSPAGASQVQNIQYSSAAPAQQKATASKPRTTNPAITALVTSLMNSAQQFQQGQAANQNANKSIVSTASSNATILNLLNSAPAAMTHSTPAPETIPTTVLDGHKTLLGRTVSLAGARLIAAVTTASQTVPTYTQQTIPAYRHENNDATNVTHSESALLERLIAPAAAEPAPHLPPHPAPHPAQPNATSPPMCQLQGLSLASLQGLQGLQNVQFQIPGLSAPISLSLNVSGAPSGLLVSVPPTTSVVLTNQPSVLSLPIAQLMSGGVKGAVGRGAVQLVRGRAPALRPAPAPAPAPIAAAPPAHSQPHAPLPALSPQYITQTQTLQTHQVRRKSNQSDGS